jgi:hypothetical protein
LAWTVLLGWVYRQKNVRFDPAIWRDFFSLVPEALSRFGGGLLLRLAWLAAFWLLASALGALLLRPLRLKTGKAEGLALAAGLGAGLLSIVLFGLGLVVFEPGVLKAGFILCAAAAALSAPWWWRSLPAEDFAPAGKHGPWGWAALVLIACAALMNFLAAMAPEVFYDSLVYHLALPELYLQRGRIGPVPHNIYSGLPLAAQALYGLALAVCDDRLASLLHASFGLWTAAAVWLIGRRHLGEEAGVFAAFAFYLCPAGLYASWGCGVDLASSFLCAAAMLALMRGLEEARTHEDSQRWAACAGLLCGFAAGTKYNVLPVAALFVLLHAWRSLRLGRGLKGTALMSGCAAAAFSPWLLKNVLFFGNPLYPFLTGVFGGAEHIADWAGFLDASGSRNLGATLSNWAGWKEFLLQPWTTSTGDWPLGDWPGPVFILLLPLVVLIRLRAAPERVVVAAAGGGYLLWGLASRLVRYMLPSFPMLSLCAALTVRRGVLPGWARHLAWAAALYAGLFNFEAAYNQGSGIEQWRYLRGEIPKSDYLKTQRVTYGLPYYAAAEFINRKLPPKARVLLLGESRSFYIERDVIAATVFDYNPFWGAVRESKTPEELLSKVRAMGITHIFMSARQLMYREYARNVFPREEVRSPVFQMFWGKYLRLEFEERDDHGPNPRWLSVYRVLDSPNLPSAAPVNPAVTVLRFLENRGKG